MTQGKPAYMSREDYNLYKLGLWKRFKLRLTGKVYVGDRFKEGWKEPIPHYAFKCPTHGIVEDYPHGHKQRLECPRCREETQHGAN